MNAYGHVYALAVSGTNLYAGGKFTTAGGVAANRVAKWDGNAWSALGSGMSGNNSDTAVTALVVLGTDLYARGAFTTAGGIIINGIAKWDGNAWSDFGSGMDTDASVYALLASGTNLCAVGMFGPAGGTPSFGVATWNGISWSAVGSSWKLGLNAAIYVYALAVSGTNLYAGGDFFFTAGGTAVNNIAKWDGNAWSALGSGMNYMVEALAISGTDLYAGGWFTTAGGTTVNHIAKWDGSAWSALGSGVGGAFIYHYVYALAVSGTDLYAGGGFTTAGDKVSAYIAKANLAISPPVPLHLQNCRLSAGEFACDLDGEAGRKLLLQASSDLKHWVTLQACQLTNSPLGFVDPESRLYPKRYYRLMAAEGVAMMEEPRWLGSQFNLNLVGELGRTVVLEGSTNLANWSPLATNLVGSDPIPFTDPESSQFSQRFYRLMLR